MYSQHGFTLLELLIAVTIFAIGLLTVGGMQITAMRANATADNISAATAVAQGVFEDLMSREAEDSLFDTAAADQMYVLDSAAMNQVVGGTNYQATYSVILNEPAPGLVRIDVSVTGNKRSVRLSGFKRVL